MWNTQTLDRWLTDPEKFIPGQKMGYQVPDAVDRADIVAYLQREWRSADKKRRRARSTLHVAGRAASMHPQ